MSSLRMEQVNKRMTQGIFSDNWMLQDQRKIFRLTLWVINRYMCMNTYRWKYMNKAAKAIVIVNNIETFDQN